MNDPREKYMRRALELARKGCPYAVPNPFVGAVIVGEDGNIIGEGYHRRCGEAHAEVNAIRSVADPDALHRSTMYVTLEPCAHYGRTPPCARLIIDSGIPHMVVATRDPFSRVDGRGIEMMRQAGIDVSVGMLGQESRSLNAMFFTAHTLHRPFIFLKWAQSLDGYMDAARAPGEPAAAISTPLSRMLMHRFRAICGAVIVGSGTVLADDPALDTRLWPGPSPRPVILDRRGRMGADARVMGRDPLVIRDDKPLADIMRDLYDSGFISVLVEGGPTLLRSFIDLGLWDAARIETAPVPFGDRGRAPAPSLGACSPVMTAGLGGQTVRYYSNNSLFDVKNL